ncbi:hypothetical protein QQX98_005403 [Neonectria punicea]|uniref:Uncharacterized protein n=1 Tax=Neonectria punicea TaxID=979145 RepID=A0ABR1H521_9HYPO
MDSESTSARTLSERLNGYALALSQMAGLIYDGEYSIRDFTAMYLENPRSAHSMNELAELWNFSFKSLDKDSFSLLGIDVPSDLEFLKNKFTGFSAALRQLTTRALIKRDKDVRFLTVHHLTQRKASRSFKATRKFCGILNDYQGYLYENCAFKECEKTCVVNRIAVSMLTSSKDKVDLDGSIISHQAQVTEKPGNPQKAIDFCRQGINLRLGESLKKLILIAYSKCNLGIIYSSANDFEEALECFQQSRQYWAAHFESEGETRKYATSILVSEARCMMGSANRRLRRFESAEAHFMEAQSAWVRSDQSHLHPFNAGILYNIGACCFDQGKVEASIKHIKDSLEVTEFYSRVMPVEHGRSLFKLSEAVIQNTDVSTPEAVGLREKAEWYLKMKKPDVKDSGAESAYDDLIPVYWR